MSTDRNDRHTPQRLVVQPDLSDRRGNPTADGSATTRSTRVGSVAGLRTLRRTLSTWIDDLGIDSPDFLADVQLGVVELVTNAFVHGTAEHVDVSVSLASGDLVVVNEHASSIEAPSVPSVAPAADSVSGRGLFIVDQLARERVVSHADGRSRTTLWIPLPSSCAADASSDTVRLVDASPELADAPVVATASSATIR